VREKKKGKRKMKGLMEMMAINYVNKLVLEAYNIGYPEHSITITAYRCSCGKLLTGEWDIGNHYKKGHTMHPIKVQLSWKIEVEK